MYAVGTRHFWSELLRLFLAVFATVSLLMRPSVAAGGILRGLSLCYHSVIPALFPLFVLSKIILSSPFAAVFSLPLYPYTRLVLRVRDKRAATALLLGLTGGFGSGASCLQTLYQFGAVSGAEVQRLLWCSINAGPAFVVACVGSNMLGSAHCGWLLYIALCLGSLCCGVAARFFVRDKPDFPPVRNAVLAAGTKKSASIPAPIDAIEKASASSHASPLQNAHSFAENVRDAVFSTLTLCGFVLFFSFLLAVVVPPSAPDTLRFLLTAPLEVTSACAVATAGRLPFPIYFCCAALSIMGVSIWMQVRSLLEREIPLSSLFLSRLLHLPASLIALHCLLCIFPIPLETGASAAVRIQMPADACCAVFLLCCTFFCISSKDCGLRFFQKRV